MATNLLLGVKDAVVGTVDGLIDGIKYVWNNPLQTIEGVTFFSRALHSGTEENDLLLQMIEESGKELSKEFIEGDADKKTRMLGQAVGEVLLALVSTKGVTAAVDAIKAGIKSGELASWFSKFSKGTATAEDIANGLGKTAETVDKADDSVKIIGNIEGSEIGIKGGLDSSLLDELANSGVKYNPDDVVAVTKTADGKLTWLENGSDTAGLNHIIKEHGTDFANKGISQEEIPNYITQALNEGKVVGYQGRGTGRPIYEFSYNGTTQRVAITVGSNGFIVGANPVSIN